MPALSIGVPLINGINYAWANISFVLFGVPVTGITSISYKEKLKKDNNYGSGQYPISRAYGNYEYEGSIDIYMDLWKQVIAAATNRNALAIPPFDIQVVYGGSAVLSDLDILRSVEFMENPFDIKQGDTKSIITIPLIIAKIDR